MRATDTQEGPATGREDSGTSGCSRCSTPPAHEEVIDTGRRSFLTAALTTVAVAPGVTLLAYPGDAGATTTGEGTGGGAGGGDVAKRDPAQAVTGDRRWGLLIDTNKCTSDCTACVKACQEEQGLRYHDRPQSDPHWIRKLDLTHASTGHTRSLPMMCQHCNNPPCADVCPTGATFRRADGIVLVDRHICIGCRYCLMSCPYQARFFVHEGVYGQRPHMPRGKGTAEGCTLCVHRVDDANVPACVEKCNEQGKGAMTFGDLKDPESSIRKALAEHGGTQVRADLNTDPGVVYQGF